MLLKTSKILAPICNRPILYHILNSLKNIDFVQKYIVLGENCAQIKPYLPRNMKIVIQPQPRGTGDAFGCACAQFTNFCGRVLLLNGDGPIVSESVLRRILSNSDAKMTIFTGIMPQNENLGRIKRQNGRVVDIIEASDCAQKDKKLMEKNLGIYSFDNRTLQKYIKKLTCNNAQNEYYVTDLVKIFAKNHQKIATIMQRTNEFYLPSVNDLSELSNCEKMMQNYINLQWLRNGVHILYPDNTYIDCETQIDKFSTIYPNCVIINSKIGENCTIYPNCVIKNAKISPNCTIGGGCVVENSIVSNDLAPLTFINKNNQKDY